FFLPHISHPPSPPLFPYTTLFRSTTGGGSPHGRGCHHHHQRDGDHPVSERGHRADVRLHRRRDDRPECQDPYAVPLPGRARWLRSEEHTSELQSRGHLVCRLLLEK